MIEKPMPHERDALLALMALCMNISNETKADCFFSYAPHVNGYCVNVHREGWKSGEGGEYLDLCSDITSENIKRTFTELNKIYLEVKEKENGQSV